MKSGCEMEIAASAVAALWRDKTTVLARQARMACEDRVQGPRFKVQSCKTRVEFRVLPGNMVGKVVFEASVKPSQSQSNHWIGVVN